MQDLLDCAAVLGEPIVDALRDTLTVQGPPPNHAYLSAVLQAVEAVPELRNTEFGTRLLYAAHSYTGSAKAAAVGVALQAAVAVCRPESLEELAVFVTTSNPIRHRQMATMRPDLCSGLALLTVLAQAGLHPKSQAALLNCCKLLMDESVSLLATSMVAHTIGRMPDKFGCAAAGEPMNW